LLQQRSETHELGVSHHDVVVELVGEHLRIEKVQIGRPNRLILGGDDALRPCHPFRRQRFALALERPLQIGEDECVGTLEGFGQVE